MDTPKYYEFMNPTLQELREGGGTLTNEEIVDAVARMMHLPNEVVERQQAGHANMGEVAYRIAWAKSYLKHAGYLAQSARGIWALTPQGKDAETVDMRAIVTEVRQAYRARRKAQQAVPQPEGLPDLTTEEVPRDNALTEVEEELSWKEQVLAAVLALPPDAFERLSQRLLRECGFTQVAVLGRSGDGGIDGKGVLRLGGLINFQVVFQCKRYTGTVSASVVRDFRGAMIGRADKGLIITTGTFSRDARAEAIRDGAPAIDLVDGQELAALLKQYELGVKTVMVEKVLVDGEWFGSI
jgi:restriction system protein